MAAGRQAVQDLHILRDLLHHGPQGQLNLHYSSVRFRPDSPRQLEERNPQPPISISTNFKPYQLKPKRGRETFIEPPVEQKEVPPPQNTKRIKHMKRKLGKLNKKIRHSKKKHNNLVSKRNSIKKTIKEQKGPLEPEEPLTQ